MTAPSQPSSEPTVPVSVPSTRSVSISPTAVRCYRYALCPTPRQAKTITHAAGQARRFWNELGKLHRWAEQEQRYGRREALLHEYGRILAAKTLVGRAVEKARKLMAERGIGSLEEAIAVARAEQVQLARRYGRRRLALAYAMERALENSKQKDLVLSAQVVVSLTRRFSEANTLYIAGKRPKARLKADKQTVSLQRQVKAVEDSPVDFAAGTVDIATMVGSECCRSVRAVLHRPLPVGARVKQVVIASTSIRTFLVVMVEAPTTAFLYQVPAVAPDAVAGIDPGRKTALSVSDTTGGRQFTIEPPLLQDQRFLRKQRRLKRKADRQFRAANPKRFDEKGRWKKPEGAATITGGLRETRRKLAVGRRHIADARQNAYHLGANQLLQEFAVVGVGTWRGRGKAPGRGKSKRAQNRKDHGNAIAGFARLLRDKAARSSHPRQVLDICEKFTTKHCYDCGEPTGPSGLKDLKVRVWTCSHCGQTHQRDFASARAIARRTLAQTAAGAQPAQPEPPIKAARTPAAPSTKGCGRKAHKKSPLARNLASKPERRSGVSAASPPHGDEPVGVEVAAKPAPCSQPPNWYQPDLPLGIDKDALRPRRRHANSGTPAASDEEIVTLSW